MNKKKVSPFHRPSTAEHAQAPPKTEEHRGQYGTNKGAQGRKMDQKEEHRG